MDSIGETLRRAREQHGLTLDDVGTRTRINPKYLDAIEKGDRSAMPGGFFYKSFVRQYAAALSPDDPDLVDDIERLLAAEQSAAPIPEQDQEAVRVMSSMPVQQRAAWNASAGSYAILLVLALIGCSGLYAWWHRMEQAHAAAVTKPSQRPAAHKAEARNPEFQKAVAEKQQAPKTEVKEESAAIPPGGISLQVTANDDAWFSLNADGKTIFSGVLQAGETKTFAARENARMKIGNAGGIEIKFNGKPTGPIGPKAQVRTVVFTPEKFEIVTPKPPEEKPKAAEEPANTPPA